MSLTSTGSAALERHLKKIYDCLNIGSNKKAVQEVDRLPKNVKDQTVFKALKALALIRMSKRRQAFDILEDINHNDDLDEVTLQTITSCYRESVHVAKIVDLYEAASARKPQDPEVMARLFMAYVRVFNFKRQKEIALQMYKTFAKDKRLYSFWAIISLIMQSQEKTADGQDVPDKKVCLSLAEKMCEKMIDDERTQEEIELYLMILRKQNKYEEEYRFLTGPICLRLTDHLSWYNRRRAYLCLDLKMYSRAFKHYFPSLIQDYPDQIEYYQGLFKSAFLLDTENPSQQQPVVINEQQPTASVNSTSGTPVKSTSALAECFDIVEKQCQYALESHETSREQKGKSTPKSLSRTSSSNPNRKRVLRGPFIARIELFHTIISNKDILPQTVFNVCKNQFSTKYVDLGSLYLDFFQSFARKVICFYDLDYMLNKHKLTRQESSLLLKDIKTWIDDSVISPQSEMSPFDVFHIVLNYHMLEHALRPYKTSDTRTERIDFAKKYIELYDANMELGKQSNTTEFLPVDHYCLLTINAIMTNAVDLENFTNESLLTESLILSLLVMAETAIVNSPSNHQIKLLLLKLYSFVGASKQCYDILQALDIKHFQIDTLGHLLNPVLYNTGNYSLSRDSLDTCLEFYAHGLRECFEGLTTSYRDGRFSKIEEISQVLRRLSNSLNATQCILLRGVVANLNAAALEDLTQASQSFDQFGTLNRLLHEESCKEKLTDSRDFKVLKSLHFETNQLVQDRQLQTFEDEKLWLRLRYLLLRSVYYQLEQFNIAKENTKKNSKSLSSKQIEHCRSEFEKLLPLIKDRVEATTEKHYSFLEPEASPFRWDHANFNKLVSMVEPLVFCTDPSRLSQKVVEEYCSLLENIVVDLEGRLSSITSLVLLKQTLMSLTISFEFISLSCSSLVALNHIDAGLSQTTTLTSKQAPVQVASQQSASRAKSITHQLINKTEAYLTKLSNSIKSLDLKSSLMDKLSNLEEALVSNAPTYEKSETKSGVVLLSIFAKDTAPATLNRVKEKLFDSYSDSLKEIESTCRRKIKLLRAKA